MFFIFWIDLFSRSIFVYRSAQFWVFVDVGQLSKYANSFWYLESEIEFSRWDFWNGSGWIQWDTEVRKNSVKVEFERVAVAPLTPLIGSKWCFHFINNSGSYRTKKGPSRLKSEGGKTQKYKMKLERELLLLISMPEFQSRHKKKDPRVISMSGFNEQNSQNKCPLLALPHPSPW